MTTPEVINIESLLKPITEDQPCGPDLRENGSLEYQKLKDARRTIASLTRARKFDSQADPEIDDLWREIYKVAPQVLEEQAKDLEVAAWYAEAALKLYGFQGLRDAFKLIQQLVEAFWDDLYPLPDEDGLETKVFPITGLNGEDGRGTLILPIKNIPLSENYADAFTYNLYDRCVEAAKMTDDDAQRQRFEDIGLTMPDIQAQVDASSLDFCRNLLSDLEECLQNFNDMSTLLDEKCGYQYAPPSSAIKQSLSDVLEAVKLLTKGKIPDEPEAGSEAGAEGGVMDSDNVGTAPAGVVQQGVGIQGPIASRDDAINHLLKVAEFFRRYEPHSPLCGVLERAVRWGRLPIQELMLELIPDATSRAVYAQLTGVPLGEDAVPIGELASLGQPKVEPRPQPTPSPAPEPAAEPAKEEQPMFGQEDNYSGW
ncbi:MAG: type VI secretion system protein TssA [Pseudomonadales bacterium]|nr:type VI secretion system protein TssA [Pseudomonadales bacterium]